jgi:hypothetical protein
MRVDKGGCKTLEDIMELVIDILVHEIQLPNRSSFFFWTFTIIDSPSFSSGVYLESKRLVISLARANRQHLAPRNGHEKPSDPLSIFMPSS